MMTCGECKWWKPDIDGFCHCPVPMCIWGRWQVGRNQDAARCPCFAPREETDHEP